MCEKHIHRIPEVSYGRLIRVGLVGPKPRPKGVGDGQRVNIPVPLLWRQRGDTEGRLSVPIGHGASPIIGNAGVGKSALDAKLKVGGS